VASSMAWLAPDARGERVAWRRLAGFRCGWYRCLGPWADALFGLTDAVLCVGGPVCSLPRLSLEPVLGRGHGSAYAALAEGAVGVEALRNLLAAARPPGWPLVFAVDGTSWPRCDAETSPGRGYYYHPSRHSAGKPIVAGWWYQQVSQLNFDRDSWSWPVDCRRIHPREDSVTTTARQVRDLLPRLGPTAAVPLFVFDGGYDPIALAEELAADRAQILVRIKGDRVFYGDPPGRVPGGRGRPRRHGPRFDCKTPATWAPPAAQLTTRDNAYGTVTVAAWARLHPQLAARGRWAGRPQAPIVRGWVIRVEVQHLPRPTARAKKTLWLWWSGPPGTTPDLDLCWRAYIHRFDIEHAIKFQKSTLGWVTPSLRHPGQADRWTALILAAYAQLVLARPLAADQRLPWERPRGPSRLTPGRVRRDFPRLRALLPPVASPRKPCTAGPGRPKGSTTGPAQRHPAIKKAA
jgi:Transposase DDE domain